MNSGGKRKGAGRKVGWRKPDAERRSEAVQCKMTRAERDKAEVIGGGNAAKGLRVALHGSRADPYGVPIVGVDHNILVGWAKTLTSVAPILSNAKDHESIRELERYMWALVQTNRGKVCGLPVRDKRTEADERIND